MAIRFGAILSLLFALSFASAHSAPSVDPTPMPAPKRPDFTPFSFLVGTWTCASKETDRPSREPWTATWRVEEQGYWLTGASVYPPVSWFPYKDTVQQRITFDASAKLWIYENWHSMGGYNLYTSPGFIGNTAVWTDRSFLPTAKTRAISTYTLKRIGARKYLGSFALTNTNGSVIAVQDTCTKS